MSTKKIIPSSILVQLGLLLIILFVFYILASKLMFFIPGFLGALCLFVLLVSPYKWLTERKRWNSTLTIITLMLSSFILVLAPLFVLIQTLTKKVLVLLNDKEKIQADIQSLVEHLKVNYHVNVLNENNMGKAAEFGTKALQAIVNTSVNGLIEIGVAYLILFFMLKEYKQLEKWIITYLPLRKDNIEAVRVDMNKMVISNTVGLPLTAFLQGIVAYIGYLIFGIEDSFMFFVLTVFAAMLPVVGSCLIYVPLVLSLFAKGDDYNAIGLGLYCIIIVGLSDNLFRFLLQKKMANIHPLITIFGVIIGVNIFGFIGIIFGPVLFSAFMWLIKIYYREFVLPPPVGDDNEQVE